MSSGRRVSGGEGRVELAAALALGLAIIVVGLAPSPPGPSDALPDWAWHAGAYLVLAALLRRGSRAAGLLLSSVAVLVVVVGHGMLLELLQELLTSTRRAELGDLLADGVGAAAGLAFARALGGGR